VRKLPARKLLGTIITAALFMPQNAFTLGLGEIEVNSALNQKFNADIELLSTSPEDTESLIVKLASREEFSRAGLDRPYLLSDLRFKSVVKDGVPRIEVTSTGPIREPFLNFLIEVDWPNGHLMREYTVLLDPPVFMTQTAAPATAVSQGGSASDKQSFRPQPGVAGTSATPVVVAGAGASSRPSAGSTTQPDARSSQPVASPQSAASAVAAPVTQSYQAPRSAGAGNYRIKQGDTAWSLADAMRPDQGISVAQMMVALLRSNPESFINENVNGLKRGYILRVPDYDDIAAIDQAEARSIVQQHAAMWREYQQNLAGEQPVTAMEADTAGSASGMAGADGTSDEAYLDIVSAGSGSAATGSTDPTQMSAEELRAELALARERVETERVEKEALQQRVNTLEQHVDKMKGMLSIEDAELAEVQSLNLPSEDAGTEVMGEAPMSETDSMADADAEETAESSIDSLDKTLAELETAEGALAEAADETAPADEAAEGEDVSMASDTEDGGEAVFVDEQVAEEAPSEQAMPEETDAEEPVRAPAEQPSPIVSREPTDPLSRLLNDPMMLAAAGGGLLLIAALIALMIKRRKAAAENEAEEALTADLEPGASSDLGKVADDVVQAASETAAVAASASGEEAADFDSESTMVLNAAEDTVVAEPGAQVSEAEEVVRDDIIAEADVYLAYGIYQQAEELLRQAISDNPDRNEYRVKLAETFYASKNADAFVGVATELKDRVDDSSETWKKILGMGQDLCADNPLFQGTVVGAPDVAVLSPDVPEMDFDLGINAPDEASDDSQADDAGPDFDLSLDDDALAMPEEEVADTEATQMLQAEEPADVIDEVDELEFDLSETEAVEESALEEDDGFSLDIDASELDIEEVAEADTKAAESEDVSLEDMGELDFALDDSMAEESPRAESESDTAEEIAFDLSEEGENDELDLTDQAEALDMDFDLGEEAPAEAAPKEAESIADDTSEEVVAIDTSTESEDDFDLSNLDDVDEVSTKLDLARAYLDMGDHEGTRGILEEVLAEGNDEQKQEAQELMEKLG
jgi:pilus assembly protein FimV